MALERRPTNQSIRSHRSAGTTLSDAIALSRTKSGIQSLEHRSTNNGTRYANSSDPFFGHVNHLSREQEEALGAFKATLVEHKLYTPAADDGSRQASHDDGTLLRFLRARKFEVQAALAQFKDTEEWRESNQIATLYENIDVDSYEESRRVYPQWTGRRDRRGIPVYVYVIKDLNSKNMAEYSSRTATKAIAHTHTSSTVPGRLLRLFALYENMLTFVLPLCSSLDRPNPESPIVSTTNIVDISGVGLKQFWNLKGHMQDASVLATAHYPESLDRIFILGAPPFFPTVWGWIKRWFDPVTTSKIFILSASEVKPTLTKFMDPSSIPKRYGGELDWNWGDTPNMDEPAYAVAGFLERIGEKGDGEVDGDGKAFVKGPVAWKGDQVEIYGSLDGKPRRRTFPVEQRIAVKDTIPHSGTITTDGEHTIAEADVPDDAAAEKKGRGCSSERRGRDRACADGR